MNAESSPQPQANSSVEQELNRILQAQRRASVGLPQPTLAQRKADLTRLERMIVENADAIVEAVLADYGVRSPIEIRMSELFQALASLRYSRKRLRRWMKPRRAHISWIFRPSRAKVYSQPLGVVGIISPWNYPMSLTFIPLIAALAAGNRVMIKPSEITPRSAEIMRRLIASTFPEDQVAVITGGPDVGQLFSALPFDHLLFTGSTQLGRHIMRAASANLTPVTLELGGKSPVIVHPEYPAEHAAERILAGKYFNGGQTCIAPDYVLVQKNQLSAFVTTLESTMRRLHPTIYDNPDYTAVVNQRHYDRLQSYLADARTGGARIIEVTGMGETPPVGNLKIPPTFILDTSDSMKIMQEEIFGPLLPIIGYDSLDEAIHYINARPRPLALYYFDRNPVRIRTILQRTTAGGVTINDTLFHVAQDDIPFGGVGESGMGAYHGKEGFDIFSHRKSVFYQSRFAATGLLTPPYSNLAQKLIRFMIGR